MHPVRYPTHDAVVNDAVLTLDLPFAERLASGKVREIFALGSDLMLVATDRISAFDVVMREGVPGKGRVLTAVSYTHLTLPTIE